MAEKSAGSGLVWLVIAAMIAAGIAAYALVPGPGTPGGGGGGGGGNLPPVAVFTPVNQTVAIGASVEFNGADSSDPDGHIASFEWSFGDGAHATGAIAQHEYTIVGSFNVSLTVTDDGGETDTASTHIYVNDFAAFAPGFVNWTTGQPATHRTVGSIDAYAGATELHVVVNVSTVQIAGAKVNISVRDPQDVEMARESRTIAGSNLVTQVSIMIGAENLTEQGTWSVILEVGPAQPGQFLVSVGYNGYATVRYDPL